MRLHACLEFGKDSPLPVYSAQCSTGALEVCPENLTPCVFPPLALFQTQTGKRKQTFKWLQVGESVSALLCIAHGDFMTYIFPLQVYSMKDETAHLAQPSKADPKNVNRKRSLATHFSGLAYWLSFIFITLSWIIFILIHHDYIEFIQSCHSDIKLHIQVFRNQPYLQLLHQLHCKWKKEKETFPVDRLCLTYICSSANRISKQSNYISRYFQY